MPSLADPMTSELRKALAELRSSVRSLVSSHQPGSSLSTALEEAASKIDPNVRQIIQSAADILYCLTHAFAHAKTLDEAGWLPHRTMPFNLVSSNFAEPERLAAEIEVFYHANWNSIRAELERGVAAYAVDQEVKDAFLEGLSAHQSGFYRANTSLMFATIERAARSAFNNGSPGSISTPFGQQSVIDILKKMAGDYAHDDIPAFHMLFAFQRLTDHAYSQVKDDATVQNVASNPVPNRHAALHGLVKYTSYANSLNAIFLADYALAIIDGARGSTPP